MGHRRRSGSRHIIFSVQQGYRGRNRIWGQLGHPDSGNICGNMEAFGDSLRCLRDTGDMFGSHFVQKENVAEGGASVSSVFNGGISAVNFYIKEFDKDKRQK